MLLFALHLGRCGRIIAIKPASLQAARLAVTMPLDRIAGTLDFLVLVGTGAAFFHNCCCPMQALRPKWRRSASIASHCRSHATTLNTALAWVSHNYERT